MKHRNDDDDRLDDEMLTRLLNLADQGPEISPDNIERARTALRPVWLETVRARKVRKIRWLAGAAAAIVLLVSAVGLMIDRMTSQTSPITLAHVEALGGEAWVETVDGNRVRLAVDARIPSDATILAAPGSRVAVRMSAGQSVRIDESTAVRFAATDHLQLDRGAVYVDSGLIHAATIRISTPLGRASDIGTSFLVRYERDEMRVLVRSGIVMVGLPGQDLQVDPGRGVVIREEAAPRWLAVEPYAEEWNWARAITPPFTVEGRTVEAFLKWYERETGREVEYASSRAEHLARQTTIYGKVVEVAPELAAESILLSAGLEGTVDRGALVVRAVPGESVR